MFNPYVFDVHNRSSVAGRTVLITGAAQGLGASMSAAFAGAGANVAMIDVDEEQLHVAHAVIAEHGAAIAVPADVRRPDSLAAAVSAVVGCFDGIDVVLNNAAAFGIGDLWSQPESEILDVLDVNVVGAVRLVREALPHLVASRSGRVINLGSIAAKNGLPRQAAAYIASKGGVIALTRAMARDLGEHDITVNSISPGGFATQGEVDRPDAAEYNAFILSQQCLPRRGHGSELAAAALFLASDAASFVTGQTMYVDGGWIHG